MMDLQIDVEASTTVPNSVTVKVTGRDESGHAVCLFFDEVTRPNWFEKLLGVTWSDKLALIHSRAEKVIRDYQANAPELDRILFPYRITKQ